MRFFGAEEPPKFEGLDKSLSRPVELQRVYDKSPYRERIRIAQTLWEYVNDTLEPRSSTENYLGSYKHSEFNRRSNKPQVFLNK